MITHLKILKKGNRGLISSKIPGTFIHTNTIEVVLSSKCLIDHRRRKQKIGSRRGF